MKNQKGIAELVAEQERVKRLMQSTKSEPMKRDLKKYLHRIAREIMEYRGWKR